MGLAPGPYEISRTQAEMGHALTVFCGARPGAVPEPIRGARLVPLPRAFKGLLFFTAAPALLARYLLHRARHRVDVIHGHAHVTQWFNLWRLFFRGREPYFYHLHVTFAGREIALLEKGYKFSFFEKIGNRAGRLCDTWGCRAANHIFVTNESVKEEAVRHAGAAPDRITVIRNGVNAKLFRPRAKDAALLARLNLSVADRVLLYVGVLNGRKNLGALLDALARLPERFKLVLAGDGPAAYVEDLKARSRALGLEGRVSFAGYLAYPDLPPYYSLCDVFVLPSLYEGFPKVLLEALASAKPAVVHRGYALDPGIEAHVDKADCADPADLAARIVEADGRGFKGDHARFVAEFSWRSIMEKVEEVYARYLPPGSARAEPG
jgi:glycosyltransferase involved in cell wall biosynthesis